MIRSNKLNSKEKAEVKSKLKCSQAARFFALGIITSGIILGCNSRTTVNENQTTQAEQTEKDVTKVETEVVSATVIDSLDGAKIDKALLEFLSKLNRKSIASLISKDGVIVIQQHTGANAEYSLAQRLEDLLTINELALYLSDSSAFLPNLYYRLHGKCELDESPSGIYIKPITFEMSGNENNEAIKTAGIDAIVSSLNGKTGYRIILSFKDKTEYNHLLDLTVTASDKGFVLSIVDQRECGA